MNWTELLNEFLADESADWNAKTANYYRYRLSPFLAYLNANKITALDARSIKRFQSAQRSAGLSWSTRNGFYTCCNAFCRWLRREGVLSVNPFSNLDNGLKRPRKPRTQVKPVRLDYALAMIEAAENAAQEGDLYATRDVAVMQILLSTGARREELVNIQLRDVNLQTGEVFVTGKRDNERYVFLRPDALAAVKRWLKVRPAQRSDKLFVALKASPNNRIGDSLRPDAINDLLIVWRNKAELPKVSVSPHKWRHLFASEFAKHSRNVYALKDLLGHSDISITEQYVTLNRGDLRQLVMASG